MVTLLQPLMHTVTATPPHPPPRPSRGTTATPCPPLHFARVRFPAAVHLPEAATADDAVNAEVVHGELERARKRPGSPLSTCTACPGGAVPREGM